MNNQQYTLRNEDVHKKQGKVGGILLDPTHTKMLLVIDKYTGHLRFPKVTDVKTKVTDVKTKVADVNRSLQEAEAKIKLEFGWQAMVGEMRSVRPIVLNPVRNSVTAVHTLYYVTDVPTDAPNLARLSNEFKVKYVDIDRIKKSGWYGNTRLKVTKVVMDCLSQIKEFCLKQDAENIRFNSSLPVNLI